MFRKKSMKKLEKKLGDLKGLLSLARKAGYVVIGLENLLNYDKKLFLLLCDKSAGKSTQREMNFLAKKRGLGLIFVENLAQIVAIENCKAVGIRNKNFSDMISKEIESKR